MATFLLLAPTKDILPSHGSTPTKKLMMMKKFGAHMKPQTDKAKVLML